jgi:hypothetical protein
MAVDQCIDPGRSQKLIAHKFEVHPVVADPCVGPVVAITFVKSADSRFGG